MKIVSTSSCFEVTNPAFYFPVLTRVPWIGHLAVRVVAFNKVLKNSTAFKDTKLLAIGPRICNGRDAAIGVDFQVPWLFLLILSNLDMVQLPGKHG